MKRSLFFILCLSGLTSLFVSCKREKPADDQNTEPVIVFSKEDSTTVRNLVNTFIERLQENKISEAVSMIYFLDGDSICELNDTQFKNQARSLARVRGIRYDLEYIKIQDEKFNDAKINIVLFDKQEGDTRPNGVAFHLNPVRREGEWYLTTLNSLTDTNANERPEN